MKDNDNETIFEAMLRFTGSIKDEIRDKDPSGVSIDFWLFKLERRIKMLQEYHEDKDRRGYSENISNRK